MTVIQIFPELIILPGLNRSVVIQLNGLRISRRDRMFGLPLIPADENSLAKRKLAGLAFNLSA